MPMSNGGTIVSERLAGSLWLLALTAASFLPVVHGCEQRHAHAGVLQVVQARPHQARHMRKGVDLRAGHAAQVREQALHARGDLVVGKHQLRIHALEHVLGRFTHVVMREVDLLDDAGEVGEAAAVVRAQDALVGHVQTFEHVHHVVPALEGDKRALLRERLRFLGRFLAVAVVGGVQIPDTVGLAQRFQQKRVVSPAGARDLLEADAVIVEERLAVNGRPDGWVMAKQVGRLRDGEGLLRGLDAVLVAAVELALLLGVWHPDAPVGRLDDVERLPGFGERAGEGEHIGVHALLDPIVWLHDGDPFAMRFGKPSVAGGAVALVLLVDDADTAIVRRVFVHDLKRIVGAAVVEADDVERGVRLPDDAVEALPQIRLGVEYGQDNRYQ